MRIADIQKKHRRNNGGNPYGMEYLSASRLKCFQRCPQQFYQHYILGHPIKVGPAMFKGSMAHAGIERFFKSKWLGRPLSIDDICSGIASGWDAEAKKEKIFFKDNKDRDKSLAAVTGGVQEYLVQYNGEMPSAVEAELRAPLPGLEWPLDFMGFIDMIREDDTLVEIKTTSRTPSATSKDAAVFSHSIQLAGYDYLYRKMQGHAFKAVELRTVVFGKSPKVITTRVEKVPAIAHDIFHETVRDLLQAIETNQFSRNTQNFFCPCEFSAECFEM